jgi:NADH dehydrogenase [ubiquinone] 1 alpha subcomplex assembly factor 3
VADITPETLAAIEIMDPIPDLLVVGTGSTITPLRADTMKYLREIGVKVDASDTPNATSTFNVLVEEGRCVAAALLPAGHVET